MIRFKIIVIASLISLSFLVSSCWFLASENKILSNQYVPITDSLSNEAFIGEWKAKEFTYGILERLGYVISDSLALTFNGDGSFIFESYPQGLRPWNKHPKQKNFSVEYGSWKVTRSYQYTERFELRMRFKKSELFEEGFSISFSLYNKNSVLTILTYMDDPDLARIVEFTKKPIN